MNFTTLIMSTLGLLLFWLTLVKPRAALLTFIFSLMAFNDYLGGLPSSIMELGGNLFYAADFFLILLAIGLIRSILWKDLNSRIDKPIFIMMLLSIVVGFCAILIGLSSGYKTNVIIGDFRRYCYYPWAIFIPALYFKKNIDIRALERCALGAAAVICTIATYRIITWSSYWPEQHGTEFGYFRAMSYHDYLVLIFVFCIVIGKVLNTKERSNLLHKVCLVVIPIFVIASNYRVAPLLMTTCSLLVFLILRRSRWGRSQLSLKPVARFASMGILLIAVVCFTGSITGNKTYLEVKTRIVQNVIQFDWSQQESYRGEMWKMLFKQWETSPLMGVGYGRKFDYQNRTPNGVWYWVSAQNIHNSYLELLLKSGILGVTIFLCLQLVILFRCWRLLQLYQEETPLVAAGIAFIVAVLVQTGIQPFLTEPNSIVMAYLIVGSVISMAYTKLDKRTTFEINPEYLKEPPVRLA